MVYGALRTDAVLQGGVRNVQGVLTEALSTAWEPGAMDGQIRMTMQLESCSSGWSFGGK